MYACICAAVTDAEVATAIGNGARTTEQLERQTGAGTGCGSCHDHLCDMIALLTETRAGAGAAAP